MIYYVRIVDLQEYWWLQYSNYRWTFDFSTTKSDKSGSFLIDDEDVVVDGDVVVDDIVDGDVVNDSVVVDYTGDGDVVYDIVDDDDDAGVSWQRYF